MIDLFNLSNIYLELYIELKAFNSPHRKAIVRFAIVKTLNMSLKSPKVYFRKIYKEGYVELSLE